MPREAGSLVIPNGPTIPVLYEDRAVLAIDKPAGWLLAPDRWTQTARNLQLALVAAVRSREFWARSRQLNFIRYVHRLDGETSGALLLAKSPGALAAYSRIFRAHGVTKLYLAVVRGQPRDQEWICRVGLSSELDSRGRIRIRAQGGEPAETRFRVLSSGIAGVLVEAVPVTGRTHQIRVHLAAGGTPVLGDRLYDPDAGIQEEPYPLALRAVHLSYQDPFQRRRVRIDAPAARFLTQYGLAEQVLRAPELGAVRQK